ncbi:hypothetical protein IPZ58_08130 [Streptomyces roseoverticillatus]|uniref:hypothetical protein n=1 Tax=Streptomyces roseoverticillatus TaxID=66429 RepID=UPI001F2DA079|nr:hypothetical protein [Streptomyces roseoverticillatus]MCF3101548.1 hypothetical protein [Streptomyces roseoverticillatus]
MRKAVTWTALTVTAATLATGCGSGLGKGSGAAAAAPRQAAAAHGEPPVHRVTFELHGTGSSQVTYVAWDRNATEQVSLPWTKTVDVTFRGAEPKDGVLLALVPGSVYGTGPDHDDKFATPPCVIKVDGRQVAAGGGGGSVRGCEYTLKVTL